ncbi:MAG: DUF4177 domain-containing protein [Planctomycetota bacterium]|jgi:hypothetical protein
MNKIAWTLLAVTCLALFVAATASPPDATMEYRFVRTYSGSKDDAGERIGATKKAELVANEMAREGWALASSSHAVSDGAGSSIVLVFERPVDS